MPADTGVPLCSYAQFTEGAFADLVADYDESVVSDYLWRGTRLTEEACGDRRLAPFTLTETHRADAVDPDEYAESANLPMDMQGALGWSYAQALGSTTLVRHAWVNHFPPHYPDLWEYSGVSVTIIRSYGGTETLQPTQILDGPDDIGHVWFQLGLFLPIGSRVRVTYSGGYTIATPASLVQANELMTAAAVIRELQPESAMHDPEQLRADAIAILDPAWVRT